MTVAIALFAVNVIKELLANRFLWYDTPLLQGQMLSSRDLQGDHGHPPSLGVSQYLGISRGESFPPGVNGQGSSRVS